MAEAQYFLDVFPLNALQVITLPDVHRFGLMAMEEREVLRRQLGTGGEDDRPLHGVFQLAHVARPGVELHLAACLTGEALYFFLILLAIAGKESVGQQEEVVAPFAQGRDAQFDGVDAVEQVLAELPAFGRGVEVGVRGANEAHVHGITRCGA